MGATLEETLAELELENQERRRTNVPPRPVTPPKPAVAAPPKAPAKEKSLLQKGLELNQTIIRAIQPGTDENVKTTSAVGASILRAPGQLYGGTVDTIGDFSRALGTRLHPDFLRANATLQLMPGPAGLAANATANRAYGASLADTLSARNTLGQVGYKGLNQFSTELAASAIPVVATGGAGIPARIMASGAGAGVSTSADNIQDRALNTAIGAAGEGAGEVLALGARWGLKMLPRKIVDATPEEAAKDALDRAFATRRTEEAQTASLEAHTKGEPVEPLPQESLPAGTRVADTQPSSVTDDANKALELAGVAERIDVAAGPEYTAHGKITVSPAAKVALDEQGLGGPFAARATAANGDGGAVIFKEVDDAGGSRVVGSMGRADLDHLSKDVASLKANPSEIDLPAGSDHGQWTMAQLGADWDAPSVLRAIVDRMPKTGKVLSDKELFAQAEAAADALGQSPEDALAFAREVAGSQGDAAVSLKTMQTIWAKMGSEVNAYMDVDWGSASDDLIAEAALKIHNLQLFSGAMEEAKSGAGRALRSLQLPDADSYASQLRRNLKNPEGVPPTDITNPSALPRTREEMKQWLGMWDALKGNPQGQANFLKGIKVYPSGQQYLRTAFANFFTGNILSGPPTIAMNILGPGLVGGLRTLERTVGASFMAVNPMASAASRDAARAAMMAAPKAYVQTLSDVGQAFKFAAASFKQEGNPILAGANPVDFNAGTLKMPQAMIAAAQADGKLGVPYHLGNLVNLWPRAVWAMHGTTNEFATILAYRGEVRASAMLEAHEMGLKGSARKAHIASKLDESVDNATGAATDDFAIDSANRTTMVRATDDTYNKGAASVMRVMQSWRSQFPELRYVLPVLQVPANALGETIRRIPGANLLLKESMQELSGNLGPMRQAEAHGRWMLGAGFLTAGGLLARAGQLTGAGPQDAQDRRVWLETHQPYSMKIGDQWVAYNKMDPIGPLLAITAGLYDRSVYKGTDQDTTLAAIGGLAQYFKDKAAIQGIADLLNFGGDPRDQATLLRRFGSVAKGFAVPAWMNSIRTSMDGNLRTKREFWDYVTDAIPGASQTLDPVRNILGENVHKPQDMLSETLLPLSMSPVNSYAKDPVLDEIDRLYNVTGYTPGMLSPSFGGQAKMDMRDAKLENGLSLYDAQMKARQTVTIEGVTLRQALQTLFDSEEYNASVDGTGKVADSDDAPMQSRGGMMQQTFTAYNKAAKAQVAQESPLADRWMAAAKAKTYHNDVLRGTSLENIVKDPSILTNLGIDLAPYQQGTEQ